MFKSNAGRFPTYAGMCREVTRVHTVSQHVGSHTFVGPCVSSHHTSSISLVRKTYISPDGMFTIEVQQFRCWDRISWLTLAETGYTKNVSKRFSIFDHFLGDNLIFWIDPLSTSYHIASWSKESLRQELLLMFIHPYQSSSIQNIFIFVTKFGRIYQ